MAAYSSIAKAFGGDTSTKTKTATVTSIGQLLDLYIVHFIITVIFLIGGIILMDKYGEFAIKPLTAWDELFYAIGAVAMLMSVIFIAGLIFGWISKGIKTLDRDDDDLHWLHALSITASSLGVVWGILALILTFGSALAGTITDDAEVAGYFMVILSTAYFVYLTVRYITGLAGEGKSTPAVATPVTSDTAALLAAIRSSSAGSGGSSAQPIFGGLGGAAAFGGIDLGGLQPSSMSTVHAQASAPAPQACAPQMAPMMIFQGSPPAAYCPDPNKIHLG